MRRWGVLQGGKSLWWPSIARNKESVVLDLKDDADRGMAVEIFAAADIVVENFAPGRLTSWGLDNPSIAPLNLGLIMVHVSGFGQDGPRAGDRGFGSVAEAMGGLRSLLGYPDRAPVRAGISLGDEVAALFAVSGALAALAERNRTGRGQEVDVALYESVFALTESLIPDFAVGGVTRTRTGSTLPGVAPSNVYSTSDGVEILIAANSDSLYRRLCLAMGRTDLVDDPRFATRQARGGNAVELDGIVENWPSGLEARVVEDLLDKHENPRGRIYTPADILADEQYRARGMVTEIEASDYPQPIPMPNVVPRFTASPAGIRFAGPRLGEHTASVRREFGTRTR